MLYWYCERLLSLALSIVMIKAASSKNAEFKTKGQKPDKFETKMTKIDTRFLIKVF